MNEEEVIEFLLDRPGYMKKGATFLAVKLDTSEENIKAAKRIIKAHLGEEDDEDENKIAPCKGHAVQQEEEITSVPANNDVPKGMEVKSMWTKADGSMGYSYKAVDESVDNELSKEEISDIIKEVLHERDVVRVSAERPMGNAKMNIYMSDEHLGCDTSSGMYSFIYGPEEMKRRHLDILASVGKQAWIFGDLAEINIVNLGDSIDGQDKRTTRGGHELQQNLTNREVFTEFLKIQKLFIDSLVEMDVAAKIKWQGVANSNHGGDMEFFAFTALQEYIKVRYPDIEIVIHKGFLNLYEYDENHVFVYTHGKDEKFRLRALPLNLSDKDINFINEFIDYHQTTIKGRKVHVIKGDLHQSASFQAKKFRYRNCGSLLGSSAWIQHNFGNTQGRTDYEIVVGEEVYESHVNHI